MSDIIVFKPQQSKHLQHEAYDARLRDLRNQYYERHQKEVRENEQRLGRLVDRHEEKTFQMEVRLEKELLDLRNKHKKLLAQEKKRLQQELNDLKKSHQKKLVEVQTGQEEGFRNIIRDHERSIKNSYRKFLKEKQRLQS